MDSKEPCSLLTITAGMHRALCCKRSKSIIFNNLLQPTCEMKLAKYFRFNTCSTAKSFAQF